MIYEVEACEFNHCPLIYMNNDKFDAFVQANSLDEFMIYDKKPISDVNATKFIFAVYNGLIIMRKNFV